MRTPPTAAGAPTQGASSEDLERGRGLGETGQASDFAPKRIWQGAVKKGTRGLIIVREPLNLFTIRNGMLVGVPTIPGVLLWTREG